jgi:hypothetical protein
MCIIAWLSQNNVTDYAWYTLKYVNISFNQVISQWVVAIDWYSTLAHGWDTMSCLFVF